MTLSLFNRAPIRPAPASNWGDLCDDLFADEPDDRDPDGLRYYQRDAYRAIIQGFMEAKSQLVVMATGLGKTELFSAVAKHWDGPVLVLANRNELVDQALRRLEKMTGRMCELEQADWVASPNASLVAGSIQSFNKARLERLGKKRFALVIADEAHLFLAPSYRRALEWFDCPLLGVTATPDRGDEKALGQIFDRVPYVMDILDGIDAGYLVPVKGRRITLDEIELDNVGKSDGDLTMGELDQEMLKGVEGIVKETLRLEPGRQGIAFLPGVASAELCAERFNALIPGSARFVSGSTPKLERKRIVDDFRAGRFRYLCNCQVATLGFDCPPVSLIIQGRPTLSRALAAQMAGRGTRVLPGVVDHIHGEEGSDERRQAIAGSAKKDLVVLDFVGNSKHALVTIADVLGGNYEPAEVEAAKKKVRDGELRDPHADLIEARKRELERIAKATKSRVKATVRDFDPFKVYSLGQEDRYVQRFGEKMATEGQLSALRESGVEDRDLEGLTKRGAGKLLDVIRDRRKRGLCSYKQLRQLQRFGVTETEITVARASAAITYISQKKWSKGAVDPKTLNEIIHHKRDGGDDD